MQATPDRTALAAGVGITMHAISSGAVGLFFAGALVAGAGFGASFHAAIRTVVPLAEPHERAGVLSVLFVIVYLAMGLPAVLAGIRVVHGGGLVGTAGEYGIAVIAFAGVAFAGSLAATLLDAEGARLARRRRPA